jgi:hypothetical protein
MLKSDVEVVEVMPVSEPERVCFFCEQAIKGTKAVQARTKNAWAHFSCWYDGAPVKDADGETL